MDVNFLLYSGFFPKWKPGCRHKKRFKDDNQKERLKALRHSSGYFISNKKVRNIIFMRDNHKCKLCGSSENLSIDHIISVYRSSIGEFSIDKLNKPENLQTLCISCNSKKAP